MDRDEIIRVYFQLGLSNDEILCCLAQHHKIVISIRTLKRITKRYGLFRRKHFSDILNISLFILTELESSGNSNGYRWMYMKCRLKGLLVSQKTVRLLLEIMDPEGVEERTRKRLRRRQYLSAGPNAVWHMDGYDKLKPYGICIHGCIDGFSRQIVWLEAWNTNNNPKLIAGYFINAVKRMGGCPERIRSDAGTENTFVKQMQIFLRSDHTDRYACRKSFVQGTSVANQRIEFFWGVLRKQVAGFWMNLFKQLRDDDYYTGDYLDQNLIQFCFMKLIQEDLDRTAQIWNCHRIHKSSRNDIQQGRPMLMYTIPVLFNADECIKDVNQDAAQLCETECIFKANVACDDILHRLCIMIIEEKRWTMPTDPHDMCDLYINLRQEILVLL